MWGIDKSRIVDELGGENAGFSVHVYGEVDSTNTILRKMALDGFGEWTAVIAESQTAGRGRLGRSFHSPRSTGLYISVLLRPKFCSSRASLITTAAAVAACNAIEEIAPVNAGIKWVNDIFVNGRKVCGILTEAAVDSDGAMNFVVCGVGINVYEPDGGFPEDIKDIAGAVLCEKREYVRENLAAAFLRRFKEIYGSLDKGEFVDEYIRRSVVVGKRVKVICGDDFADAEAIGIDSRCRLIVRYRDGRVEHLASGEVSIRF